MIKLTRLGGEAFILNADLIRYVEARPDTFITLTSGERLVVRESMDEVLRRAVEYQRSKYLVPPPSDVSVSQAKSEPLATCGSKSQHPAPPLSSPSPPLAAVNKV